MWWATGSRRRALVRGTTGLRFGRITTRYSGLVGIVVVVGIGLIAVAATRTDAPVGVETAARASTASTSAPVPSTGSVRVCPDPESDWNETVSIVNQDGETLFSAPVESRPVVFNDVPAGGSWLHLERESAPAPPTGEIDIGTAVYLERHPITVTPAETIDFRC